MRKALEVGTTSAGLWRGMRDQAGELIDLELVECTQGYADWVGRPLESMPGTRYTTLAPSGIPNRLAQYLAAITSGEPTTLMFEPVTRAGRAAFTELRIAPCGDDLIYVQAFDVSSREGRFHEMRESRDVAERDLARTLAALNASPDGFAVYLAERDADGSITDIRILLVNDAAAAPTGRPSEAWQGARLVEFFPEAKETGLYDRVITVLSRHEQQRFVIDTRSAQGWEGSFENLITPFGPDLALITWREKDSAAVSSAALLSDSRDRLTGVLARTGFLQEFDRRRQHIGPHGAALLVIDFDNFGQVNDVIGQHAADSLLARFATETALLSPRPTLVGRIGPDEFAMLFEFEDDHTMRARFQRELVQLAQLAKAFNLPRLTATAGYTFVDADVTGESLLHDCDTALRYGIAAGGSRITAFTPALRRELVRRSEIANDIVRGLNSGAFAMAYQQIVDLADGSQWGAEALIRWRHPELGLLYPAAFIPAAEASGLIVELGSWVVDAVVAHLAATPSLALATCNVASRQLLQDDIPVLVGRALEAHGVSPSRFVVEITESALLPDSGRVRGQMRDLRSLGVAVALDDFGSGYSSMAYLDRLPVDIVKLDGYFLDGELTDRRRSLLASTAAMVRSLGARSLIEHVETQEQRDIVREAGVDLGQGYLFGHAEFPAQ